MAIGSTLFGCNRGNLAFENDDVFPARVGKRHLKFDADLGK